MSAYPEGNLRQRMAWLHSWVGLLFGWVAFAVFFSGALSVYASEIGRWMTPETARVSPANRDQALTVAQGWLARHAPDAASWRVELPSERQPLLALSWQGGGAQGVAFLNPSTGRPITPRDTEGGEFLVEFHYSLHAGQAGIWVVGACSLAILVALVSGVIVHRRLFADFFTFRPQASPARAWLDAHNALSVLPLPFHFMILITALSTLLLTYLPAGVYSRYGEDVSAMVNDVFPQPPVTPEAKDRATMLPLVTLVKRAESDLGEGNVAAIDVWQPGSQAATANLWRSYDDRLMAFPDRVSLHAVTAEVTDVRTTYPSSLQVIRTLGGLHYGYYAAPLLRALYFFLALCGAAMIGTGLVLYTAKPAASGSAFGRAAHRLNVAMICGPICACAAYFLANRLAWPGSPGLHEREVTAFFLTWAACSLHALWCKRPRLWGGQWRAAAWLWTAIVPVDILTSVSDRDLAETLFTPLQIMVWVICAAAAAGCWYASRRQFGAAVKNLKKT